MVQDIEHFRSKLQPELVVNRKITMNGEIPLRRTETSQRISSQIALPNGVSTRICGRRAERSRTPCTALIGWIVKCLAGGGLCTRKMDREFLPSTQSGLQGWC